MFAKGCTGMVYKLTQWWFTWNRLTRLPLRQLQTYTVVVYIEQGAAERPAAGGLKVNHTTKHTTHGVI